MSAVAIRPDFKGGFASLENSPIEKPEEKYVPDDEDQQLHYLSTTPGWKIIEEYIKDLLDELDGLVKTAMANGASFEEIGQKTMVKEMAKEYLNRVLDKVTAAKQQLEGDAKG